MAHHTEQEARGRRLVAVGAVCALAVATALAFGRVFAGRVPMLKLLVATLLSLAVAALLERRSLLLATGASAVMLLAAIGWLVYPRTLWYGLPSRETLEAIGRALGRVGEQARVQVAPTPPLAPLLLAAVTAVWTATFSAHALAVRAGSPLLAVLPPVALVGFADTVMEDGARPIYAITFLLGVLAVVFIDGLRRIHLWGPVWAWRGKLRRLTWSTARGAERVALLAVAIAVLAPGILPGFRAGPLMDFSSTGSGVVDLDPFVSIKAQLTQKEPVDLFRVTSTDEKGRAAPAYWRLFALDRFNGADWTSSDPKGEAGQLVYTPARIGWPLEGTPAIEQRFEMLVDLPSAWLPMAYPPETVEHPDGTIRYNAVLGAAVAPRGVHAGDEYLVTSRLVAPTAEELGGVTDAHFASMVGREQDTFVPNTVPEQVRKIALEITAGATTPYERIFAIQRYLTSNAFHYTTDVEPTADANAIVEFLSRTREGFCQQFATAMTVLVRELGYPARVAVGFRPGKLEGTTFTVTSRDLHSWVEVDFPGYGWLPFEPTPTRPSPLEEVAGSYLNPTPAIDCPKGDKDCEKGGRQNAGQGSGIDARLRRLNFREGVRGAGGAVPLPRIEPVDTGYRIPYGLLLLVLAALGSAFLLVMPIAKTLWRRQLLRRAHDPRELVLATYRLFDGEAADLGLGRRDGETLAEHGARLSRLVEFSDGHLGRLTDLTTQAAYSRWPLSAEEARGAVEDARTAIRDVRRSAGLLRRFAGIYRPGL